MADDELKIKVKAELDDSGIKDDVVDVGKNLAKSDDGHVKLVGQLDIDETRKKISAQLKNLKIDGANVDIGVNTKGIKEKLNKAVTDTDKIVSSLKSKLNLSGDFSELKTSVQGYLDVLKTGDTAKIGQAFTKIKDDIHNLTAVLPTSDNAWDEYFATINKCVGVDKTFEQTSNKVEQQIKEESQAVKAAVADYKTLKLAKESYTTTESGEQIAHSSTYKNKDGSFTETLNFDPDDNVTTINTVKNLEAVRKAAERANIAGIKLRSTLESVSSAYSDENAAKAIKDSEHIASLKVQYDKVLTSIEAVEKASASERNTAVATANAEITKLKDLTKEYKNAEYAANQLRTRGLSTSVNIEQSELDAFINKIKSSAVPLGKMQSEVNELKVSLSNVADKQGFVDYLNILDTAKAKFKSLESEAKTLQKSLTLNQDKTILSNRVAAYMASNTKAAKVYRQEFEKIQAQLKDKNLDASGLKNVRKEFQNLTTAAKAAGNNVDTLGDRIKKAAFKFSQWMSLTTVISTGVRAIKDMVQNVIDLDTAMVSLKKVTDETETSYNRFLTNSYENAKKLGKSVSDLVEQTAEWSKLGYKLSEATDLAQVSSIYANVGEVDNVTAVSDLVTVIKAFNIETSDTITIVNALNKLGNEFATSAASLGDGLSNAASAMSLGGMSLEKTLALLTGGAEITQSAGELGNALKMSQMRVMGMKGALEELGEEYEDVESVSKIQTHILNLTEGQVNIMNNADPTKFKEYYDILEDVSEVYDTLDPTKAADLLETLFGKQRGNQGAAIIQAFQSGQIQKAYEAVQNSAGSAMAEQEKWLDSIEAKLNQLEATAEQFSATIVDDNSIKNSVDMLSGLLSVLNDIVSTVGTLPTLIGAVTAALSIKNVGKPYGMCHLLHVTLNCRGQMRFKTLVCKGLLVYNGIIKLQSITSSN